MCANNVCKEWWAAVVYNDGKGENVPITHIKKFTPSNLKDFNPKKTYKIKSVKWSDGENLRYLGFIQRLAENEEALIASLEAKRPCRPRTRFDLTDGPVSSTDSDRAGIISAERESKNGRDRRRREADVEWASFNLNRRLNVGTNISQPDSGSSTEELRDKITKLERELAVEKRRRITAEGRLKEQAALLEVTKRLEMVEEKLRNISDEKWKNNASPVISDPNVEGAEKLTVVTERSTQGVADDKVSLGEGIFCLLSSWKAMKESKCTADWCVAILRGVFGEEAKLYLVQPRKTSHNLRPFPKAFLEVAKVHYKSFLVKIQYDPPTMEKALHKLPGVLANRATDMNGRRVKKEC
ncbi:uncharacterized protein LOC124173031 [Ischnura elegans]|uniref:uncharacterized protein LOC124173031 n=1 Tax=Ischnura elegans TaxID=197161 RepID=UPI001ED87F35|nr:uncharacterized protein LOC124173031 [Ischnura elegans]